MRVSSVAIVVGPAATTLCLLWCVRMCNAANYHIKCNRSNHVLCICMTTTRIPHVCPWLANMCGGNPDTVAWMASTCGGKPSYTACDRKQPRSYLAHRKSMLWHALSPEHDCHLCSSSLTCSQAGYYADLFASFSNIHTLLQLAKTRIPTYDGLLIPCV